MLECFVTCVDSIDSIHNKDAEWLKKLKEDVALPQQADLSSNTDMVIQFLRKVPNWKVPGQDIMQGFWLINFYRPTPQYHKPASSMLRL